MTRQPHRHGQVAMSGLIAALWVSGACATGKTDLLRRGK